jgi:hypothetical protein
MTTNGVKRLRATRYIKRCGSLKYSELPLDETGEMVRLKIIGD